MPCWEWGDGGSRGLEGPPGALSPHPGDGPLGTHMPAGRQGPGALSTPAQVGLTLAVGGGVTGALTKLRDAAGSYWCHPKMGSKKRTPSQTTGDGKRGFALKIALCPTTAGCFPNSGKYPKIHLSSRLRGPRDPPGSSAAVAWDPPKPSPAGVERLTAVQGAPTTLCIPGGRLWAPAATRFTHPGTSWEGCEPRRSCRAAQLPFPASPACPDGVAPLDPALLYRAQPFPALGQPEEA